MKLAIITGMMIFQMIIMMSVGIIGSLTKVITKVGTKALTDILLLIVTPILIVVSYQVEYSPDKLKGLCIALGLSFISHLVGISISLFAIKKQGNTVYQEDRMAIVYSNCGFMGIPLLFAVYGSEGVFYVTAYLTVFNLLIWSHGISLMSGTIHRNDIARVLKSPNIIAILIGIFLFIMNIRIPIFILKPLKSITLVNTPLAMLVIGATLVQSNLLEMIKKTSLYYVTFLRLVLVPLLVLMIFKVLNQVGMIPTIIIIASSCPIASTGTMFALKFNKNSNYAASLLSLSTVLCMITIPLVVIINEWMH